MSRQLKVGDWVRVLPVGMGMAEGIAGHVGQVQREQTASNYVEVDLPAAPRLRGMWLFMPYELMYCHDGKVQR